MNLLCNLVCFVFIILIFSNLQAQSPGNVSNNLQLWFQADAGLNEGSVNAWIDDSGNNNDISQATAAEQPICVSQSINFNPSIVFDGNSDHLPISSLSYLGTNALSGMACFVVFKSSFTNASYSSNWAFLDYDRSDYFNVYLHGNGGLGFSYNAAGINDNTSNTTGFNDGLPHIGMALYNNAVVEETKMYMDGLLDYSADRKPNGATIGSNNRRFGFVGDGSEATTFDGGRNSFFYNGSIAELIYYDIGTLNNNEIERIHSYLAVKYGITLGTPANPVSYINSAGVSIWAADPVYQHHIAGITRDDQSGLLQFQSKSEMPASVLTMQSTSSFDNNLDAVMWGSNNAAVTFANVDVPSGYNQRLQRIWKSDLSGNPGSVSIKFILPNSGNVNHYALFLDNDETFSTGATQIAASSIDADTIIFNGINLADGQFFTIAQKDYAPGNVVNDLALWYRADYGITEGGVDSWLDCSGNKYDVAQAAAASQPVRSSNSINFNPSLAFDGANDFLPISSLSYNGANAMTGLVSFVVFKTDYNATNYNSNWAFLDFDRSDFFNFYLHGNGRLALSYRAGTTTDNTANTVLNDNLPHLGVAVYDNNLIEDTRIFADGLLDYSADRKATGQNIGRNTTRFGFLGDGSEATAFNGTRNNLFYEGSIAELILYDAAGMTDLQIDKIQSYLAIKYGLTLGNMANTVSYLNSSGNTIWVADALYQNDIAGIGRDDATGLDQRRSLSVNNDAAVAMQKAAFANDQDYLVWGNDNAPLALTNTDVPAGYESRLSRIWKTSVSGAPGTVDLAIIYPNTNDISRYALHTDADGIFASGTTEYLAAAIDGDTIFFRDVTFTDGLLFTLSKKTDLAPGAVQNNLKLWLKANDGPNCTTNGCLISGWTDKSTNSFDMLQTSAALRPLLRQNTLTDINYNPVVDFDGLNDQLIIPNGILGSATYNDLNIYSVVVSQSISSSFMFVETCNPSRISMHVPWIDNNFYWDAGAVAGAHRLSVNWSSNLNKPYLWSNLYSTTTGITIAGTMQSIRQNGFTFASDNSASPFTGTNSLFTLANSPGGNPFNARIAEFVVYTGPVNAVENRKIESYLAIKYAMTLSNVLGGVTGDYLASDGSTIWDASFFPEYHSDIIGIGRDDAQGLYQKQSHTRDDSVRVYVDVLANNNSTNAGVISNESAYIMMGSDRKLLSSTPAALADMPPFILDRIEREWKVTNSNFTDDFTIEIKWDVPLPVDLTYVRLLVDDDGDFSDATILGPNQGLTFNLGSIIISGINTNHIPLNSTRFITVAFSDTDLPVELLDFDAQAVQNHVELTWSTASETNNDYFVVERSQDGITWEDVVRVEGHVNSLVQRDYQAFDLEPFQGVSYYRLRQTDLDGTYAHSHSVAVDFKYADYSTVTIFPNPAQDEITIRANNQELESCQIFNLLGQNLTAMTKVIDTSNFNLRLNVAALESGVYLIKTKHQIHKIYKE